MELREAKSKNDYQVAKQLFVEYASQIGVDLEFQDFNNEISGLEKQYSRPKGSIYIVYDENQIPLGCFGVRELKGSVCELKRMYLKKEARGLGLGKELLKKAIYIGKVLGYQKMRLDTLPSMHQAIGLYKKMGFYEISSYRFNPIEGTKYFEIDLLC